jgi:opacity protein-like surface antigen
MRNDRYGTIRRQAGLLVCGSMLLGAALFLSVGKASAAELIPSVGLTRSVDSDDTESLLGLALRGSLISDVVKTEIGAQYRSESLSGGDVSVRQWPVTASLWLSPVSSLYAGAGVGWYHTTYDYEDELGLDDNTTQDFGVHVGGGLRVPVFPQAALDLQGRYVFLQDQESQLVPESFDPDFWSLSLGLAIGFNR